MRAMTRLADVYRPSLALSTDLYQLTMAQAYRHAGRAEEEAVFHLFFRRNPFGGGFAVACGLLRALDYLDGFHFTSEDVAYLSGLTGNDGRPLFDPGFLRELAELRLRCDVDSVPEGTVVFPYEPLVRVSGPILHAQLVETGILNFVNFETLIATKAARMCLAARGDEVVDFGLRRAQGPDGGLGASRAAYVGGCAATSNVLAGRLFGLPVRGTHAHSWVMAFETEPEAFLAWAQAQPNNAVFLVDTYDTLEGVRHAVEIGRKLRATGHEMAGIRLDSGDLAYLSIEARKILDEAGLTGAAILASNDLDEHLIASLHQQGARVGVWGVGTKLATAYDSPALGGVYKLSALENSDGKWDYKIKLSEQTAKTSIPGILQVRRFRKPDGLFSADAMYDTGIGIERQCLIVDPTDLTRSKRINPDAAWEDLLVPIFRGGSRVYTPPDLIQVQARCREQCAALHPTITRLDNPHRYPAGLESRLHELRLRMIEQARHDTRTRNNP